MAMQISRAVAAVVAGFMLVFAGCSAGGAAAPAEGGGMPQTEPSAPAPGDRQIARTASVSLVVTDVESTAGKLRQLAESVGGLVTWESISLPAPGGRGSQSYSEVVISVPADRLDEVLGLVGTLGEVRDRSVESVDVTDAVLDVDARVKTLRESIARLQELMSRAGSVTEIAAVEAELSQRQADLESMLAQQKNLQNRVAMAPITVGLYPPDLADQAGRSGFLGGLTAGWSALVTTGEVALTAVGYLLPWLVLLAVIGAPLIWWRRRRRASAADRRPGPPAPDRPPYAGGQAATQPAPASQPTPGSQPPAGSRPPSENPPG